MQEQARGQEQTGGEQMSTECREESWTARLLPDYAPVRGDRVAEETLGNRPERWEYGSEFHWASLAEKPVGPVVPAGAALFGTGRDALRALVATGMRQRGWRRWFVPTYFCREVTAAIASTGIAVVMYEDSPLRRSVAPPPRPLASGDVLFVVNYFGLRGSEAVEAWLPESVEIVEDHTHDPWSDWARASRADFCLASLRKTLPVPDGAALWSAKGHPLPSAAGPAPERESAARMKLGAMILKRLYLDGEAVEKPAFRRLQIAGESRIASGDISGPSDCTEQLLQALPWERWREIRRSNHGMLANLLSDVPGVRVLEVSGTSGACPFSVMLECDSDELRERLRSALKADCIYSAVLWPIEDQGNLSHATALARRLLSLPCDFRYGREDLRRVAEAVRRGVLESGKHPIPTTTKTGIGG